MSNLKFFPKAFFFPRRLLGGIRVGLLAYVRHVALLTAPPTRDTGTFSGRVWTMANKAKFRGGDLEASFFSTLGRIKQRCTNFGGGQ
jgi:hypothetical protein